MLVFRYGIISLVYLLLVSQILLYRHTRTTLAQQVSTTADQRIGHDPLSLTEQQTALETALNAISKLNVDDTGFSTQKQILLIERHRLSKRESLQAASQPSTSTTERQSDTYIYDYTTDMLTHLRVNLTSQEVQIVQELRGVQLPLVQEEIDRAFSLVFHHPLLGTELKESFHTLTSQTLLKANQLQIKAFIFQAGAMPDQVNEYSELCGIHRCAQLLLRTQDNIALNIQPVVDLSRQLVVQDILDADADLQGEDGIDPDIGTNSGDGPMLEIRTEELGSEKLDGPMIRLFLPIIIR